ISSDGDAPGAQALPFMGLLFTTVGGVLCFGRAWTSIDGTRREVTRQWGLLVPMHSDTQRVDDYTAVVVEFVRGDSDSADKFPVSLKARAGKNLQLRSSTEYGDARACALAVPTSFDSTSRMQRAIIECACPPDRPPYRYSNASG